MKLQHRYGMPIVGAHNIMEVIGDHLGVKPWKLLEDVPLEDYFARADTLAPKLKNELKFAPKVRALVLEDPAGEPTTYYRIGERVYVITFTLLDLLDGGFVPVTAQFRPAMNKVILQLPSGWVKRDQSPEQAGKAEVEEETGILLEKIVSLRCTGVPVHTGQSKDVIHMMLGIPHQPVMHGEKRLDAGEFVCAVLVPLADWMRLLTDDGPDMVSTGTTLLGLARLGVDASKYMYM